MTQSRSSFLSTGTLIFSLLVTLTIAHAGEKPAAKKAVSVRVADGIKVDFVRIPAGRFLMGSSPTERSRYDDEGPLHEVNIGYDFYMGKFEVTQKQWSAVMGKVPNRFSVLGDDFPVTTVSWEDCQEFVGKLNANPDIPGRFRLPSEAEWEYAARAGTTTRFSFGDSLEGNDKLDDSPAGTLPGKRTDFIVYKGNPKSGEYDSQQEPVGSKKPNPFGLYNMHGSVKEWCEDEYHPNYFGAPTDGSAWESSRHPGAIRILRGGAWSYFARTCRSAARSGWRARRYWHNGLRLVWFPYKQTDDEWNRTWEAERVADNMISHQSEYGGWPKNRNYYLNAHQGEKFGSSWEAAFDNDATVKEMRFLAKVYDATGKKRFKDSFLRGLDFIFQAQYPSGGWPQRYPHGGDYGDYITFNDNAMGNILGILKDIVTEPGSFAFIEDGRRAQAKRAYDTGLECLLKCQVVVDGRYTLWGAQHDPVTLEIKPARRWEPAALGSRASSRLVRHFLMGIEDPSPEVVAAIEGAVDFYKKYVLHFRYENGDTVEDPSAKPMWARFYEPDTGRPVFSSGHKFGEIKRVHSYNEMPRDQRGGYSWFHNEGSRVFEAYEEWKKARTGS